MICQACNAHYDALWKEGKTQDNLIQLPYCTNCYVDEMIKKHCNTFFKRIFHKENYRREYAAKLRRILEKHNRIQARREEGVFNHNSWHKAPEVAHSNEVREKSVLKTVEPAHESQKQNYKNNKKKITDKMRKKMAARIEHTRKVHLDNKRLAFI
ncbi:hypothetical protein [Paenibacillus sp. Soil787]|uniref:hypothetical protein n=1 Tax=Paenibacillus sp. Soil787 TaxID=1736411 RepID=UPI0007029304|nr:hypothetical protein [Paenibacillus sp. Soil787]KRF21754.1 hypothetical protein ASG93_30660 [Paenibacillus sp. Soil787]